MVLLCIMDGFGLRENAPDNAIAAAYKPNYDQLKLTCPFTAIDGSGLAVGLPDGQMGNSEVGHLNLGAGRVVYQDITRIDKTIADGSFFKNSVFLNDFEKVAASGKALHLFGLVSDGKVHSSLDHLYALVKLAKEKNIKQIYLHCFMDGRDTPPNSGKEYIRQVLAEFDKIGLGKIATISGRYYGMDRDKRWERVDKAYRAIVLGEGEKQTDPIKAIENSYANNVTDEFILPVVIDNGEQYDSRLKDGDLALMFNFRSDRVRQLSYLFLGYEVENYQPENRPSVNLITMTEYDANMKEAAVAFPSEKIEMILGECLSNLGLKQLRTAETEKYAHVTFFFNGGTEAPFEGEDRDMIASPKVATYDLQPEMSSVEVTNNAVNKIKSGKYDFVLLNYANCDMVGHTGDFEAAKKAVEAVDIGLGKLLEAVKNQNGVAIITADHGNAEVMYNPETDGPWTAHTTNLVPCLLFDPTHKLGEVSLREGGILADIAPTILDIMGKEIPKEMTGKSLIIRN